MKNFADTCSPSALPKAVVDSIAEQKIHLTYALDVCSHLGSVLQLVPKEHREAAIASLRNEGSNFVQERQPFAAMMVFQVAQSWEEDAE